MSESQESSLPGKTEKTIDTACSILVEGNFPKGSVAINLSDGEEVFSDETIAQIEKEAKKIKDNPNLFNGKLVSIRGVRQNNGMVDVDAFPTDFATSSVFNNRDDIRKKYNSEFYPTGAGMSAILITADNFVVLAQHGSKTSTPGQIISVPAGFIEQSHKSADGKVDPFVTFDAELTEETGIKPSEIKSSYCAGIIRDNSTNVCDFIIVAKTTLSSTAISERMNSRDDWENNILLVPNEPKQFANVNLGYINIAEPNQIEALYIFIKQQHGEKWAKYFRDRVERRKLEYKHRTKAQKNILEDKKIKALSRRVFANR